MFFALDHDQRALRDSVRELLADRFGVRRIHESLNGDALQVANDLWVASGEQGWLALLVPVEYGGLGLGLVEAHAVATELGAGLAPSRWSSTVLAGEAIVRAGSAEQRERLLAPLAEGRLAATIAVRRFGAPYSPGHPPFTAAGDRLTGEAVPVEFVDGSQVIVAAADDGLYLVDPAGPGVRVEAVNCPDQTVTLNRVVLHDTPADRLPRGNPIGAILRAGAVLASADLTGIAREALRSTVDYCRTREQFGRPIGSFQAVKHSLADLHIGVAMAQHAVLYAAHAAEHDLPGADFAVSVGKSKAGDVALAVTRAMIQFHGGIGFTAEHEAHLYYQRAKRQALSYGDAARHRAGLIELASAG